MNRFVVVGQDSACGNTRNRDAFIPDNRQELSKSQSSAYTKKESA